MTDKERILTTLAIKFLREAAHPSTKTHIKTSMLGTHQANPGDLIMSATTFCNDFSFGYFIEECDNYYKIKDLASDKECCMYNDAYYIIPSDWFSPIQMLYGKQAKMEEKVVKATRKLERGQRYAGISFYGNVCTVKIREMFKNETIYTASIKYNAKTTIKEIWQNIYNARSRWETTKIQIDEKG